jgi:hypothetical protein
MTSVLSPGAIVSATGERSLHPNIGAIRLELRGTTVKCAGWAHALWHFGKAAAYARTLRGDARARFDALVRRAGGEHVMGMTLTRPLERKNFVLVVA